jgi:hypothetical protein
MIISKRFAVATLCIIAIYVGLDAWADWRDGKGHQPYSGSLLSVIRKERSRDSVHMRERDSLSRRAALAQAQADGTSALFTLDLRAPAPGTTPATDDTTKMGWVIRKSDMRKYAVPLFFAENYQLLDNAAAYWHELVLYDSSVVIPYKDTIIAHALLHSDSVELNADYWEKKAHPRCGRRCGIVIGVGSTLLTLKLLR